MLLLLKLKDNNIASNKSFFTYTVELVAVVTSASVSPGVGCGCPRVAGRSGSRWHPVRSAASSPSPAAARARRYVSPAGC